MLRRHFVLPTLAAITFALAACQDTSDSSVNATTHEDTADAGSDEDSTPPAMNTDGDAGATDASTSGSTCATATPLAATTLVNQQTASDGDRNAVCGSADAPQRFYSFVIPGHQHATLHVAPETESVIARVLTSCEATTCLVQAASAQLGDDVRIELDNLGDESMARIVSVASTFAGAGATFDIRLDLAPIATASPGATCADATLITEGTYVNQHTAADGDRTTSCESVDAPQRFYSFVLPAHERATVHVAPELDAVIARALTSCDPISGCFHADRSAHPGDDLTLVFDNFSDAPVTRYVSVSDTMAGATLTFDIRLDLGPIPMETPTGATCADATMIAASTYVNQHIASTADRNAVCENVGAPQRFYAFVLPEHQRATIRVSPETGFVIARALAECDATSCLTDSMSDADGGDITLVIDSPGDEPLTKIISVSGASAGETPTFDIRLDLTPIPEPPAG